MKTITKLILILLLFYSCANANEKTNWVRIGEGTYNLGFIYPYKITLFIPYGERNIADIKEGLLPMKFILNWLPIESSKEQVQKLFTRQLEEKYQDKESYKLSKTVIGFFINKLPPTTKHQLWNFTYFPDEGTKFFIDDEKIHHLVGAELNRALLQSWLNSSPMLTANLFNRLIKVQKQPVETL